MGEQGLAAVVLEPLQDVPKIARLCGHLRLPGLVTVEDRRAAWGVVQARRVG